MEKPLTVRMCPIASFAMLLAYPDATVQVGLELGIGVGVWGADLPPCSEHKAIEPFGPSNEGRS